MTTRTLAVFGAGGGLGTALIQHLLQQPSESNTRILAVSHSASSGNNKVLCCTVLCLP